MRIAGLNKTTLLDYPGKVAAMVFTPGCNFRCPFCHNGEIAYGFPGALASAGNAQLKEPDSQGKTNSSENESDSGPTGEISGEVSLEDFISLLKKRRRVLGGVCISGGEPTLQPDLAEFIREIKAMGLAVKLDTNGSRPEVIRHLIDEGLLDYVAMDIKAALKMERYGVLCGKTTGFEMQDIISSIHIISSAGIEHEFRTTVVPELHTDEDFHDIGSFLQESGIRSTYFLQGYVESPGVISGAGFSDAGKELLERYAGILDGYMPGLIKIRD